MGPVTRDRFAKARVVITLLEHVQSPNVSSNVDYSWFALRQLYPEGLICREVTPRPF